MTRAKVLVVINEPTGDNGGNRVKTAEEGIFRRVPIQLANMTLAETQLILSNSPLPPLPPVQFRVN